MGLLSWLFGGAKDRFRIECWMIGGITLAKPIQTPLGGSVKCIGCVVDLDYRMRGASFDVTSIRLAKSSVGGVSMNITTTRRGEAWKADGALRKHLERRILPPMIQELVASDERLQKEMRKRAGIAMTAGATAKQKAFAKRLGIRFEDGISKSAISELIDAKLGKRR